MKRSVIESMAFLVMEQPLNPQGHHAFSASTLATAIALSNNKCTYICWSNSRGNNAKNRMAYFPFWHFFRYLTMSNVTCICSVNKSLGLGLLCIQFLMFNGLIATQCNIKAVVNGSPHFCVKKANVLLNSPRSNLALHSTAAHHALLLTNTHTLG